MKIFIVFDFSFLLISKLRKISIFNGFIVVPFQASYVEESVIKK